MNLLFLGSGDFGIPTLRELTEHHSIRGVVTQPDRPAGRGATPTPTPVAQWAAEHLPGTPLLKFDDANSPDSAGKLREAAPPGDDTAWVVIAFGQKLSRALLDGLFAINLHASLLPRWRGAAPINAALLAGDTQTGVSVITLADRMDAGLILGAASIPLDPADTAGDLAPKLAALGPRAVLGVLDCRMSGTLDPRAQDESLATRAPKLSKADGWVDFSRPAPECRRRIHALNPWPTVTVEFQGAPLKLLRATPINIEGEGLVPGVVFDPRHGFVTCGASTALRLDEVQPAGKRAMPWADFARGRKIAPGEVLSAAIPPSAPRPPEENKP